jgi:hypothetical protein
MQLPTDAQIQERFDDLPKLVQDAIQSADMPRALQDIGALHNLHINQLGALEDEALLVMLGFANPATFSERVQSALRVDESSAGAIAAEVSERLFVPIRHAMREYMEERLRHPAQSPALHAPPPVIPSPPATPAAQPHAAASAPPAASMISSFGARQVAAAPQPTVIPAKGGGKTIMPPSAMPVVHPLDAMLTKPTMTTPTIADFSMPGALSTPQTPANKQYVRDPYREAIE